MLRLIIVYLFFGIIFVWANDAQQVLANVAQEKSGEIAIEKLEKIIYQPGNSPEKAHAIWLNAQYYYSRGVYTKSADYFTQLLSDYPDFGKKNQALYLYAMSSFLSSSRDSTYKTQANQALSDLLLRLEPEDNEYANALLLKVWFLVKEGKFKEAKDQFNKMQIYATSENQLAQRVLCQDIYNGLKDDVSKQQCLDKYPANNFDTSIELSKQISDLDVVNTEKVDNNNDVKKSEDKGNNNKYTNDDNIWYLQLGAFSVKNNAEMLADFLKESKIDAKLNKRDTGASILWIVLIDGFSSREDAQKYGNDKLRSLNMDFQPRKY